MVEVGRWRKWVLFYIPLTVFVVGTLFPFYWMLITAFRPDAELYRPWRAVNNAPFWTTHPTVEHFIYLFKQTMFGTWLVQHDVHRARLHAHLALLRPPGRLCSGPAAFPLGGAMGTGIFVTYLVPPTLLFIPLGRHHPQLPARRHPVGADPHLPDVPDSVLHLAPDGLLQDDPQGAGGVRPDRRRQPRPGHGPDRLPAGHARASSRPASSPSRSPGTSSSTPWSSSPPQQKTVPVGVVTELIRGDVFFWGPLMAGALLGSVPVALIYSFFVEHYVAA